MVLRINNRTITIWTIFLLAFPHLCPVSLQIVWPRIATLFDIGRFASLTVILLRLAVKEKTRFNPVVFMILVMEAWLTLITYMRGSQTIMRNLISVATAISIPLLIYVYSDYMDELLSALYRNYEWLIYASLLSIAVYYPYGMYQTGEIGRPQYFLGNENGIIFFVIPAVALALIRIKKEGKKFGPIMLILACIVNEVVVWCATGIVGLTVAGALLIYMYTMKRQVNYYVVLSGALIADYLISVVRILDKFWITSHFIQQVLGKTITLSGRTYIWDAAMPIIYNNLLTGCGRGNHVITDILPRHAHNQYFQVLIVGGLPMLILFLGIMFYLGTVFKREESHTFVNAVMMGMLACLYIQFIATSRVAMDVWIPLTLASFTPEIAEAVNVRQMEDEDEFLY